MNYELVRQALGKYMAGLLVMMALLFIPAGTFDYPQAWLLIGILFAPMLVVGVVLLKKDPELLKKRLDAKEEEGEQRSVVLMSALMFLAAFVVAGLCFRHRFLMLSWAVSLVGAAVFLAGYALYAEVLKENTYLSRTVEVQQGQKLIDTGLYGVVRHPMYTATILLFLSMPVVLGSILSFAIMLAYIPLIVKRIGGEERVLAEGLDGYRAYMERVRYRLVPHVW